MTSRISSRTCWRSWVNACDTWRRPVRMAEWNILTTKACWAPARRGQGSGSSIEPISRPSGEHEDQRVGFEEKVTSGSWFPREVSRPKPSGSLVPPTAGDHGLGQVDWPLARTLRDNKRDGKISSASPQRLLSGPLTSSAVDARLGLRLYELVSEAQGLTPERIVLLRGTAPPRMPRF